MGDEKTRAVAVSDDIDPIMSASSSMMPSGLKSARAGRSFGLRSERSHAFSNTRCLIDLTTEGLALSNSIVLAEFEQVARRNAAGRTMEKIAVDDGAEF